MPNVHFVGYRQTVHIAASDQGLHFVLTECSIKFWIEMKKTMQQPFKRKWTGPVNKAGAFHSAEMG